MSDRRPPSPEPLPHPVVDNHCHLDIDDGEGLMATEEAIRRAREVGVPRIVQIGCDLPGIRWANRIVGEFEELIGGVAIHPNEAPRLVEQRSLDAALGEVEDIVSSNPRIRAVGETGLDYYRTGKSGRAAQHKSFRAHIELAKRYDKTLVIHDRDAHQDVLDVLADAGAPERTIMHCFSGNADIAKECVRRGMWLSFAGVVTFKNAPGIREALAVTPMENILVETDAPFLTPAPHRGKPNASYLIPHTVRAMADLLEVELADLCRAIDRNTEAAYGGAW